MRKLFILLLLALLSVSCMHKVKLRGVVLSHAVTANRYGERQYTTIAIMEDGEIEELNGLECYVIPVGQAFTTTVLRSDEP